MEHLTERPWRAVVCEGAVVAGRGSFLGPDTSRRARWRTLKLSCGHEVERSVRYRSLGPHAQRGGTQTRNHSDILSGPRRVRCEFCPRES